MIDYKSISTFKADGQTSVFSFAFDYLAKAYIKVRINDVDLDKNSYDVVDHTVVLHTVPKQGDSVCIYRQTATTPIVVWNNGSLVIDKDMNVSSVQELHLIEEAQDYIKLNGLSFDNETQNWNANNKNISNVKDPILPQDVVTKHYMESVQNGFVNQSRLIIANADNTLQECKKQVQLATNQANTSTASSVVSTEQAELAKKYAELAKGYTAPIDERIQVHNTDPSAHANLIPVGTITIYAGKKAPNGYLICDGSAISRTTYAKLFSTIGTSYGTGDGSTTFNLPNLQGRTVIGVSSSHTLATTGGEETHTLTESENA